MKGPGDCVSAGGVLVPAPRIGGAQEVLVLCACAAFGILYFLFQCSQAVITLEPLHYCEETAMLLTLLCSLLVRKPSISSFFSFL